VGRIADDVIELVGFARWLGIGSLLAVLALIGNAIVLSVQSRIAEHAVLQTLGFTGRLVAALIVAEGVLLALTGGLVGAVVALLVARFGSFALSVEGQSIPIEAGPALLATGLLVCAALGVLAGLVPAIQASRREIAACFRAV
jgi:putative ABC transport system permease protein